MPKSTPGPWHVYIAQDVRLRAHNADTALAKVFGPREKAIVNARVMAAAPTMLDALRRIRTATDDRAIALIADEAILKTEQE